MQLARIKTDIGTAVAAAWIDGAVIELPASQESATTTGRSPSTRDCRSTSTRSCSPSCRAAPWVMSTTGTSLGIGIIKNPRVFLEAGDVVEVQIEGYPALRNRIQWEKE